MEIFAESRLSDLLDRKKEELVAKVGGEADNWLLNVNEEEYIAHLVDIYSITPLDFDWDKITISESEKMIPAEHFPAHRFNVFPGKRYPKQVITFHVPYTGEPALLRMQPSRFQVWTYDVDAGQSSISFDVINWQDDADQIKRAADEVLRPLRQNAENSSSDILTYNSQIPSIARNAVRARKEVLLKRANLVESLGIPLRRSDSVPETFAVPVVPKKMVVRPTAPTTAFAPEPTLDETTYAEILRIVHETGVAMERHPSTYTDKDEEALRDHLIMVLTPHFAGVTAETFNHVGKTDILIRHEGKNVFVAECKFWSGPKGLLETIDQALGYLTWRDSKAALIIFVRNQSLSDVLGAIESNVPEHPQFVAARDKTEETSMNYDFRLPDDASRSVRLAILAFHFPRTA